MTWESFFLGCFAFGFVLSLIAFLAGSSHLHLHHGTLHHGGHIGHGHGHDHGDGVSKFNFGTIAAFLIHQQSQRFKQNTAADQS